MGEGGPMTAARPQSQGEENSPKMNAGPEERKMTFCSPHLELSLMLIVRGVMVVVVVCINVCERYTTGQRYTTN